MERTLSILIGNLSKTLQKHLWRRIRLIFGRELVQIQPEAVIKNAFLRGKVFLIVRQVCFWERKNCFCLSLFFSFGKLVFAS